MIHNSTIDTQLNHKSIRKFKDITLNHEQLETLYTVFSRTATSMFMQNASLLHITDEAKKQKIQELCGQKYVGAEGNVIKLRHWYYCLLLKIESFWFDLFSCVSGMTFHLV